jgi:hypothetical protein
MLENLSSQENMQSSPSTKSENKNICKIKKGIKKEKFEI